MLLAISLNGIDAGINSWFAGLGWTTEAILRLMLAAVAGGIVGIEREVSVKHAGFRTLILVSTGSALVMLVSTQLAMVAWPAQQHGNSVQVDPGRIAYGIMTGIGFLGAGTIIERHNHARGLTTAAAIWCVAAIGMAFGFGLYLLAAITTLIVLVALWLLNYLEDFIPRRRTREIILRTPYRPQVLNETIAHLARHNLLVTDADMERADDLTTCHVTLHLAYNDPQEYRRVEAMLEQDGNYELMRTRAT